MSMIAIVISRKKDQFCRLITACCVILIRYQYAILDAYLVDSTKTPEENWELYNAEQQNGLSRSHITSFS